MKKHISLILVLMSMCVTGIVGLQLFWNYQNYKSTVKTFDLDINAALNKAADREIDQRLQKICMQVKSWMADTSFISITCSLSVHEGSTIFHIKDTHPKYADDRGFAFGITYFKEKLSTITPAAKKLLINHFIDRTVRFDLKTGMVYYYTQRLGDSINKVYDASRVSMPALALLFKQELLTRDIHTPFILNPAKNTKPYLTRAVNTNFRRPYKNAFIKAGFETPNSYFLKEMKWVIIGTLLLIGITFWCFAYTVKTLLSQHKLALLKDDFINNMTHELNTPISSIKITAEALKSFTHTAETQTEYLDIISYQAEKLTDLTGQILNTNQVIYTDKNNWTSINLNQIIQKSIDELKPQVRKHCAYVNYTATPAALEVKGDSRALQGAFTNIIDNALKYNTDAAKLNIKISTQNGYAEVAFADNGIGIPPEYRGRIFEKFFRVPQGNLHNVKGYGLGLNYVNQVIKQHGGFVFVHENQPCGSIITIKIPLINGEI